MKRPTIPAVPQAIWSTLFKYCFITRSPHLCVDNSSGKGFSITGVADGSLRSPVEGEESKVKDEKSETNEGDRVARDATGLGPSISPGQNRSFSDARIKESDVTPCPKDDTARQREHSTRQMNHCRSSKISEAPEKPKCQQITFTNQSAAPYSVANHPREVHAQCVPTG